MNNDIAIYSTYCGTTKNMTWCGSSYTEFPSYFVSNNIEVLRKVADAGWTPLYIEDLAVSEDPVISTMQGKFAKVFPDHIPSLSKYKALCFIDDKHTVDESSLATTVDSLLQSNAMIAFKKHPFIKPNVLSEYTESLGQARYFSGRDRMIDYITEQVNNGLKLTAPQHYAGTCIIRNTAHPKLAEFNQTWMEHISKCGIEDQISLFFVAQLFADIAILPNTVFSSKHSWA